MLVGTSQESATDPHRIHSHAWEGINTEACCSLSLSLFISSLSVLLHPLFTIHSLTLSNMSTAVSRPTTPTSQKSNASSTSSTSSWQFRPFTFVTSAFKAISPTRIQEAVFSPRELEPWEVVAVGAATGWLLQYATGMWQLLRACKLVCEARDELDHKLLTCTPRQSRLSTRRSPATT